MTAADTRFADADVSGRSEGGVTVPPKFGNTHPFGVDLYQNISGIARGRPAGSVGIVSGGFRNLGS